MDVSRADVVAFYVPMHTATRLAIAVREQVRELNPSARICFYGLYGQANASHLLALGADAVISGEFESALVDYVTTVTGATHGPGTAEPVARTPGIALSPLDKLSFRIPDRTGLPPLPEYARLAVGERRQTAGYTEASRGCRHKCRHCPVVPVYQGRLRIVQADVVLRDIDQQVAAGAEHITFGDPDFFNAPAHAVRLVETLHNRYPELSYDVTIKVEHLLRHSDLLPVLAATGCMFVTTAAESMDDRVLAYLDKGHTRADFIEAIGRCRGAGVVVNPTFVAFHPWSTRESTLDTFAVLEELELVESVAPIQLTTRLLIPEGSLLLDLPELASLLAPFDRTRLVYPWTSPDPAMDELHAASERLAARSGRENWSRAKRSTDCTDLSAGHRESVPQEPS